MTPIDEGEALAQEFDVLMARGGFVVPPDWRAGVLAAYRDLKAMAALLHRWRPPESEPSNVYSLQVMRGTAESES
jgi:hypothetical protein